MVSLSYFSWAWQAVAWITLNQVLRKRPVEKLPDDRMDRVRLAGRRASNNLLEQFSDIGAGDVFGQHPPKNRIQLFSDDALILPPALFVRLCMQFQILISELREGISPARFRFF
jgi:hypothetical protein